MYLRLFGNKVIPNFLKVLLCVLTSKGVNWNLTETQKASHKTLIYITILDNNQSHFLPFFPF